MKLHVRFVNTNWLTNSSLIIIYSQDNSLMTRRFADKSTRSHQRLHSAGELSATCVVSESSCQWTTLSAKRPVI